MRGDVQGRLGYVTKGAPGDSAYEIAVKHGFTGTEEEWLASLSAEAAPAQAAASLAGASATRAESAADRAEDARDNAQGYARAAKESEDAASASKTAAAASATLASTAAASASENATYIAGRVNAAISAADQAALSESHAAASKGAAQQSEANAKQSELMAAEYYTYVRDQSSAAAASATAAANSATAASASATQAETVISNFNANVAQAHAYATIAGGYANSAQTYAVSAADSADRAEAALGNALAPLANYYTKSETDSVVGAETSLRSAADSVLSGRLDSLESGMSDYYTKTEVNDALSLLPKFGVSVVGAVPDASVAADDKVYLVTTGDDSLNLYTEYVKVGDTMEELGTQALDLSGYETIEDITPYKLKLDSIESGAQVNSVTGVKGDNESVYRLGDVNITPDDIGLGNVDNTHDSVKGVSVAGFSSLASALDNADSLANYNVGDVVFLGENSPSTCFVCVEGSSIGGGE